MPESTPPKVTPKDPATTDQTAPPEVIPPLESSPDFQNRVAGALGGVPLNPSSFGPIGTPQPAAGSVAKKKDSKRPHDPAFDGPSADLVAARGVVAALSPRLSAIRAALDSELTQAQEAVEAIKASPLAKAEADFQKIDLRAVERFLSTLAKAQAKDPS